MKPKFGAMVSRIAVCVLLGAVAMETSQRPRRLFAEGEDPRPLAEFMAQQRQMKVRGVRHHTAKTNNSFTPFTPTDEDILCSRQTGDICMTTGCDADSGQVACESLSCVCKSGFCVDGHGRCSSKELATRLPGTYTIQSLRNQQFLFMEKYGSGVSLWTGDPGPQGRFHIVVNNDGTIMLNPTEWEGDYWVSITDQSGNADDSKVGYGIQQSGSFTPTDISWKLFVPHGIGIPVDTFCMRHVQSKRFAMADKRDGVFDTEQEADEGCMLRFHPPLREAMAQVGAVQRFGILYLGAYKSIMDAFEELLGDMLDAMLGVFR